MKSVKLIALIAVSALVTSFIVSPEITRYQGADCVKYDAPAIVWKSEEIDLGKIPQGKPVTIQFEFTNKGKEPVIITNVATSCGCTIADYTKEPVMKGKTSKITATYNAASPGSFTKAVTVTFANNETKVLNIKGTVI